MAASLLHIGQGSQGPRNLAQPDLNSLTITEPPKALCINLPLTPKTSHQMLRFSAAVYEVRPNLPFSALGRNLALQGPTHLAQTPPTFQGPPTLPKPHLFLIFKSQPLFPAHPLPQATLTLSRPHPPTFPKPYAFSKTHLPCPSPTHSVQAPTTTRLSIWTATNKPVRWGCLCCAETLRSRAQPQIFNSTS